MARSIFFSFHYQRDISRVNVVRNHYVTKGGYSVAGYWDHSLWEATKRRGDEALKRLIASGLEGTTVTAVLIGAETAYRPWVTYEIQQSYVRGNGILGIYVNKIRNLDGYADWSGPNPLSHLQIQQPTGTALLSQLYPTYDWVDHYGYAWFSAWVEAAAQAAGR